MNFDGTSTPTKRMLYMFAVLRAAIALSDALSAAISISQSALPDTVMIVPNE